MLLAQFQVLFKKLALYGNKSLSMKTSLEITPIGQNDIRMNESR